MIISEFAQGLLIGILIGAAVSVMIIALLNAGR